MALESPRPESDDAERRPNIGRLSEGWPHWVRLTCVTAALVVVGGLIEPSTVTAGAILSMLPFISILALASIGQHLVMQQRGFDLSVAGAISLGAVLVTVFPGADASLFTILGFVGLTLVAGAVSGALNGLAITRLGISPHVATLGMNALLVAIAIWISGGSPHMAANLLTAFAQGRIGVIPNTTIVMAIVAALAALALQRTPAGRRYVAVGASPAAAHVIGVPVGFTIVMTYTSAGLAYAVAAVMLAGLVQSPSVTVGNPYILSTVAAVAVGGNATLERRASLIATVIGSVLLIYLGDLVVSLGFDKAVQYVVQALVIIASVGLPDLLRFVGGSAKGSRLIRATAPAAEANAAKAKQPETAAPILALTGVQKSYGPVVALRDVSVAFLPGEVHTIVGENGAGKSTLIAVAAGTVRANSGSLRLGGVDVTDPTAAMMRGAGLAVAYQHPALAPDLTVLENIKLFMGPAGGAFGRPQAEALIGSIALKPIQMDVGRRVAELSTAQRHVVEIARALSVSPRILFLDEPTEPFQKPDVAKLFEVIAGLKARGIAVVYVSHRLHEVMAIADRSPCSATASSSTPASGPTLRTARSSP
jgi:ribose/xylose/arabinose/galactoside ABC-type transport system permease subunit/ABC-type branched-subunit amino acid transport system ATPase component